MKNAISLCVITICLTIISIAVGNANYMWLLLPCVIWLADL